MSQMLAVVLEYPGLAALLPAMLIFGASSSGMLETHAGGGGPAEERISPGPEAFC